MDGMAWIDGRLKMDEWSSLECTVMFYFLHVVFLQRNIKQEKKRVSGPLLLLVVKERPD
jgi:hypothetical protein